MSSIKEVISFELAWHFKVHLAEEQSDDCITLYVPYGADIESTSKELELILGRKIKLLTKSKESIEEYILLNYRRDKSVLSRSIELPLNIQSRDFVVSLIQSARNQRGSDIHIESFANSGRVRFRIDGDLIERLVIAKNDYPSLINKIKIVSGLDISEKRLPQDGRIKVDLVNEKLDVRVSVLPTMYGEKVVLRLLGGDINKISIEKLGFSDLDLLRYNEAIGRNVGIVLISGPTGSGKTTTLYATLKILNKASCNVVTIEDPIEYTLEGVNQVQVKEEIGFTFSEALRSYLRQDPDIIMVGEIRDSETANLAIRASLTGHLVLSTIHTNSAWGTILRLIDMGIPPFLISNTLVVSVAQRLVRILCSNCKKPVKFDASILPKSFTGQVEITDHFIPNGCEECYYSGYKGREAIYEVIPIDAQLAQIIVAGKGEEKKYLKSINVSTLQDSALKLVKEGKTSIAEIYSYLLDDQY